MNFRLNLAVALAAAMTFACSDQQAAIPELEEAMKAPPGARVLGLYRMDVTPVEGTNGTQFYFQALPVSKTGAPTTGSVTVLGQFSALLPAGTGPAACATTPSITAAPVITNRTLDNLTNVWVDVVTLPAAGLTACTYTPSAQSAEPPFSAYFVPSDQALGIWKYNNLAPAANPGAAGGTSTPIITAGSNPTGVWGFRFPGAGAGLRFFFRIMANANTPIDASGLSAGPGVPLAWTIPVNAGVTVGTRIQICTADMSVLNQTQAACTVPPVVDQVVALPSYEPLPALGLVSGNTYYYRVRNDYGPPRGESTNWSEWYTWTYLAPVAPVLQPLTFAANASAARGFTAYLSWTADPLVTDGWVVLCSPTCPAAGAVNALPVPAGVLLSMPVIGSNGAFTTAPTSIAGLLTLDATGVYLEPTVAPGTAAYEWRVYNYDGITAPTFNSAFTPGTITVTPVQTQPVVTPPAGYSILGNLTWIATWTADPIFDAVGTVIRICSPDCATVDADPAAGVYFTTSAGDPVLLAGAPPAQPYSFDLRAVLAGPNALIAGDTFEYIVTNPDLATLFPLTGIVATVAP